MIHKINFTISIETNAIDNEKYIEIQNLLYEKIIDTKTQPMSFDEINKILQLSERKYHVTNATSIEFPYMTSDEDDFEVKETNIKIKA